MSAPRLRLFGHSHDRDLETICARCLERDTKARYQSAGDLAIDLERWPDGRPIVARPVSPPARIWRWSRRNPKLLATGAACLLFGAAVIWFFRGGLVRRPPLDRLEKSIAVLPFSNLSKEEENTFFADGVQDEILTDLARVGDLKVISRASVMRYKSGVPRNLRKIGRQLGVTHAVEGSVQLRHNRVRVNVQLVDARIDRQLWAETYDRDLTDVFAIQSEIAQKLAQQLHAKISAGEKAAIQQPPPDDVVAYDHPRNFFTLQQIAISYGVLRRYGEEKSVLDRALAIEPSDVDTKWRLRPWNFTRKLTPERCIERSIPFEPQIPRSCRTSLMIG
jgi:TolB-like protein